VLADGTTATSHTFAVRDGFTRCVSILARDTVANSSLRNAIDDCVSAPLDERALTRSTGWTKVRDRGSYHGTLLRATRRGATLTFAKAAHNTVVLVVRRTPGSGKVAVYYGSHRLRVVDLAGRSARRVLVRAWAPLDGGTADRRTVTIRVVSRGKPVYIDGAVFSNKLIRHPSTR